MFARHLEKIRKQTQPNHRPFTWGYFCGIEAIVGAAVIILWVIYAATSIFSVVVGGMVAIAMWGIPGYFVTQRKKWAWLVLLLFSFNPIIWVANALYIKDRWTELQ
ncbi:MAG: hypothetical protein HY961_03990 [Ignavibacteriae bacterium]|nr:hypothetical protein [Ignavibacteriota bacterium]